MIGETLSHFEILELIGKGGFGEVYRARDTELDRPVALKVLPEAFSTDSERQTRFRREARAASRLSHPNICTIYEFGDDGGRTFIAMELVEGRTLRERIAQSPLGPEEMLDVAIQIAEGLAAAHRLGIVHRDIKSANIVLTPRGQVKILDFGLARVTAHIEQAHVGNMVSMQTEAEPLTAQGAVMGTLLYMAPEQLLGRDVDARTDQFAFGVVCYELLSGRLPFRGATAFEASNATLSSEPPTLASVAPEIPVELSRIVHRMLAKDPAGRFATSEDVLATLQEARQRPTSGHQRASGRSPALKAPSREVFLTGPTMAATARQVPSIAVLAFANLSGDIENEYFSDGLAEDLINALANIPGLNVASRTSSFFFKGKAMDIREIAATLGVQSVLEGSVRKAGNRIRVTAQLIKASDGYHLWSESYDRQLEDVFAIQDEISRTIAETLQVKLLHSQEQRLVQRQTQDVEAYNLYLQGRYHWNRRYRGGMQAAMRFFQQAMAKDPSFALPYSGLADALAVLAFYNYLPPQEGFPKSKAAAARALSIDDTIAEAHSSLAFAKAFYDWDWEEGDREFATALKLAPSYGTARWWYASTLMVRGRFEESDSELQLALAAEPLSAIIVGGASFHYYFRRQYDKALAQARRSLELDPAFGPSHAFLGWCHLELGDFEAAVSEWRRSLELMENMAILQAMLGVTHARFGRVEEARTIRAQLIERSSSGYVSPYHLALVCGALGEINDAFAWLERAYEGRNNWLPFLRIDPSVDCLRGDPRLEDLIRRVGLPSA
jgi:serine/threonine-protein kinase